MKRSTPFLLGLILNLLLATAAVAEPMPNTFVYLSIIVPSILQDIRYAGYHNFMGRPVKGYNAKECILTKQAARQLKKVQSDLKSSGLSLKVYDCYRPVSAVQDFVDWSHNKDESMKAEFYPNIDKKTAFRKGYIARRSSHSRGSTVDLTIVPIPTLHQATYHRGQKLIPCFAPYVIRYRDNSIDMGTGYDCLDPHANTLHEDIPIVAKSNRLLLRNVMMKHQFEPYDKEWWHFTLKDELYPDDYFSFPIKPKRSRRRRR